MPGYPLYTSRRDAGLPTVHQQEEEAPRIKDQQEEEAPRIKDCWEEEASRLTDC